MGTVLLVQSDAEARDLSAEWLRQSGFFVMECATGEEALSIARKYLREIDGVITDLILLRMNGLRLVSELRELYPQIRALVLSGVEIPADFGDRELTFLEKPIEHETLVRLTQRLLGSHPKPANRTTASGSKL